MEGVKALLLASSLATLAAAIVTAIVVCELSKRSKMDHEELLALLQAENAEVEDIGGKVQGLLDKIGSAAEDVPSDVQDAANALKTSLDALKAQAGTSQPA